MREVQAALCLRFEAAPSFVAPEMMLGVARDVWTPRWPINGLRHPIDGEVSGWYLWAGGELSRDPGFFEPHHAAHLIEKVPQTSPYLALPPGWRFLIAPGYEDVWYDEALLDRRPGGRLG